MAIATATLRDLPDLVTFSLTLLSVAIRVGGEISRGRGSVVEVNTAADAHVEIPHMSRKDQQPSSRGLRALGGHWLV